MSFALAVLVALVVLSTGAAASSTDTTWTLAGTGVAADSGDGGQAREAAINQPRSDLRDSNGGYVWAEPWSNRVRIVRTRTASITTLAGTGTGRVRRRRRAGRRGADLNFVHSAAPTPDGGYLLADTLNNRIRKVSASGVITTVAGNGVQGFGGDGGPATARCDQQSPRRRRARRRQLPDPGLEQPSRAQGVARPA